MPTPKGVYINTDSRKGRYYEVIWVEAVKVA